MVFEILALAGIPTAIATTEGVRMHSENQREKKQLKKEVDEQYRMADFHIKVYSGSQSRKRDQVDGSIVVLRDGKLYLTRPNPETEGPLPLKGNDRPDHPFTGFYLDFQPTKSPNSHDMFERLNKPASFRGLVSTISEIPPTLNWIYVHSGTYEVCYGSRAEAAGHILGPWDWTDDEVGLTLEGWEGFVAVEEGRDRWKVYYDRDENKLKNKVSGRRVLECSLERKVIEEEDEEEDVMRQ